MRARSASGAARITAAFALCLLIMLAAASPAVAYTGVPVSHTDRTLSAETTVSADTGATVITSAGPVITAAKPEEPGHPRNMGRGSKPAPRATSERVATVDSSPQTAPPSQAATLATAPQVVIGSSLIEVCEPSLVTVYSPRSSRTRGQPASVASTASDTGYAAQSAYVPRSNDESGTSADRGSA